MLGGLDAGVGGPQESFVDCPAATGVGPPGTRSRPPPGPAKNTLDDLDDIFKEVDEILENDKAKSKEANGNTSDPRETAEDSQPGREGPLESKMKEDCCEKHAELHYSSEQHGNGMLSAQPAQQLINHHLPQKSAYAQNIHPHPTGFPLNHPPNFNFGPVYNMAGLDNWSPPRRGTELETGTGDPAQKKKNELRSELEKVLSHPSNSGSWYRFDVLRTELQVLETPLCGLVTQPAEDQ